MSDHFTFFPLAFRMKYIERGGLMRNSVPENLLEHAACTAMLAHALAVIANERYDGCFDPGDVSVRALYHDISEIYTGDLPTPVKYANSAITESYKTVEKNACETLAEKLPAELRPAFEKALDHESDEETRRLVKAADKLCAYIKCVEELQNGNREFASAKLSTKKALDALAADFAPLRYFMDTLLDGFEKNLDEL